MTNDAAIATLRHVTKAYRSRQALNNISMRVAAGRITGFIGPNGSGKSTTLRILIGMTRADSGTVKLFGEEPSGRALASVGYLPEERGLYRDMTVLDHLVLLGRLRGLTYTVARNQSLHWCNRLEIAHVRTCKISSLSKGMQQKIQFIAALLHDPAFLILDEPFSGLDPINAHLFQEILLDLRSQGRSILLSSHRISDVERYCDDVHIINKGSIVEAGSVREVRKRHSRNVVRLCFSGDDSFLHAEGVSILQRRGSQVELALAENLLPNDLLLRVASTCQVHSFAVDLPSLEEVFLQAVKDAPDA